MAREITGNDVMEYFQKSEEAFRVARRESEENVRYVNNDPYSDAVQSEAEDLGKPLLKYNVIMPLLMVLVGNEQLSRRKARIKPASIDPVNIAMADIYQGRWNAILDEQDVEDKIQVTLFDALMMRVGGYMQRKFQVNEDGYLDFYYDYANPMNVYVDPETVTADFELQKCRRILKEFWWTLDEIEDEYDVDTNTFDREKQTGFVQKITHYIAQKFSRSHYSKSPHYDQENDRYRIIELQERIKIPLVNIYNPETNEYYVMEPEDYEDLRSDFPQLEKIYDFEREAIHITTVLPFFDDEVIYDDRAKWKSKYFDVFPLWSYQMNVQVTEMVSMVDLVKDIQDDLNKYKSQARDYITQVLSEKRYVKNTEKDAIEKLRRTGNSPDLNDKIVELRSMENVPQRDGPENIPPDMLINSQDSMNRLQDVGMINPAMRGESERSGESGVLFQQKVDRAAAAINPYYRNVSRLRKALAKDFIDNFAWVYGDENRIIQIQNEDTEAEILLNLRLAGETFNDVSNASIKVELDEGTDNITAQEENFERTLAVFNLIANVNPQLASALIRHVVQRAPIEGAQDMIATIDQMMEQQSMEAEEMRQMEQVKQQLENVQTERSIQTEDEKIQLEREKMAQQNAPGGQA